MLIQHITLLFEDRRQLFSMSVNFVVVVVVVVDIPCILCSCRGLCSHLKEPFSGNGPLHWRDPG